MVSSYVPRMYDDVFMYKMGNWKSKLLLIVWLFIRREGGATVGC